MFLADAPSVGSIGASFGCLTGSAETLFVESSVLKHLQADRELLPETIKIFGEANPL